ncbi:MAG: DUF3160 domain-containing protein, partial [Spirochaetales bacterium]|nr:DUF3160 domain-containing protein [Spirochaetales bacterium]
MKKIVCILIIAFVIAVIPLFGADILGDSNNDSMIDIVDGLLTAQFYVGLDPQGFVPGNSDVNAQYGIDIVDALLIAQYYVGLMSEFPGAGGVKPALHQFYTEYEDTIVPSAPGYTLPLDTESITNYSEMDSRFSLAGVNHLLSANGFAVKEYNFSKADDIFSAYEYLSGATPTILTADLLLHCYHILFDFALKEIEETYFYDDIKALTQALLSGAQTAYNLNTGDLREAHFRNYAFFAVAHALINPGSTIPEEVSEFVESELEKINNHAGFFPSDIFIYDEDYSQYVPRGHYTRSPLLEDYFKTFMWYGRMAFLLKGANPWGPGEEALISPYDAKIQTMQAALMAESLKKVMVDNRSGKAIWDRMYGVTAFFVGLADDLTPYEYADAAEKV